MVKNVDSRSFLKSINGGSPWRALTIVLGIFTVAGLVFSLLMIYVFSLIIETYFYEVLPRDFSFTGIILSRKFIIGLIVSTPLGWAVSYGILALIRLIEEVKTWSPAVQAIVALSLTVVTGLWGFPFHVIS